MDVFYFLETTTKQLSERLLDVMGQELKDDNSYIFQENTKRQTLRAMKRMVAANTDHENSGSIMNSTDNLVTLKIQNNDHVQLQTVYDMNLGFNISIADPNLIENNKSLSNFNVKSHDSSMCAFTPGFASTPIKNKVTPNETITKPLWTLLEGQQVCQTKWIRNENERSSTNCTEREMQTLQHMIIQETLNSGPTCKLPSNDVSCPFVPVARIDNIYPHTNVKAEHIDVNSSSTENIFQVPDTMIAYVFNEATQSLTPMQIIEIDENVSTYQPLMTQQDVNKGNGNITYIKSSDCSKKERKQPVSTMYRKVAYKWKNVRPNLQRRPPKPHINRRQNYPSYTQIQKISVKKKQKNTKYDVDYKPSSSLQIGTACTGNSN